MAATHDSNMAGMLSIAQRLACILRVADAHVTAPLLLFLGLRACVGFG